MNLAYLDRRVEIFTISEAKGLYGLIIKSPRLAAKANHVLKTYEAGTVFKIGEEPLFKFNAAQIKPMAQASPILGKILAQITLAIQVA